MSGPKRKNDLASLIGSLIGFANLSNIAKKAKLEWQGLKGGKSTFLALSVFLWLGLYKFWIHPKDEAISRLTQELVPYRATDRLAQKLLPYSSTEDRLKEIHRLLKMNFESVEADRMPFIDFKSPPEVGFGPSGPYVLAYLKNSGKTTAKSLELLCLIANPELDRNYLFTRSSCDDLIGGSSTTFVSVILTNSPGSKWEPPWPESFAFFQFRYRSEIDSSERTNSVLVKYQPGHPAAKLFDTATRILLHNATPQEKEKYWRQFEARLVLAETQK